ncbi:UNKNOWN [Stylonychia lemnae]|uniref:Transmembrane protein n=1 Tax=Stylonychia lemnae TaxID=5949 RepID=A0A078BA94_STYLE|nr:UNKNOWN [Stylonychia lemnae]|eukprot:CDW91161.1 UNKNOWN [Stylonychia lemnae]
MGNQYNLHTKVKSKQLLLNELRTYKSLVGASVSFLILGTLMAFLIYKIIILNDKSDTKLAKKSFFLDLDSEDAQVYNVGEFGFDFAFTVNGPNGLMNQSIGYFSLNQVEVYIDQATNKSVKSKKSIEYDICGDKYYNFKNKEKTRVYGINKFYCPVQKDFMFSLAMVNSYFDFNNFTQPVQQFIDDSLYFEIEPETWKGANVYLQPNNAQLQDEILSFSDQELQFFQVRLVYGIGDLLGDVGGFKESLLLIGMLLVGFIQERLFLSSLLKHIYQVEKTTNGTEDQDEKRSFYSDEENDQNKKIQNSSHKTVSVTSETQSQQSSKNTKAFKVRKSEFRLKKMIQKESRDSQGEYYVSKFGQLEQKEKDQIVEQIFGRLRFKYSFKDILSYLLRFACCLKYKSMMLNQKLRKHALFDKGQEKLLEELDCVTLLKSIRTLKLFQQVFLNENQKLLMKFQRKMLIDSDSTSSDSDRNDQDNLKLIESKNYAIQIQTKNKVRSSIYEFTNQKELKDIDQRLLKGVFVKKLKQKKKAEFFTTYQNMIINRLTNPDKISSSQNTQILLTQQPPSANSHYGPKRINFFQQISGQAKTELKISQPISNQISKMRTQMIASEWNNDAFDARSQQNFEFNRKDTQQKLQFRINDIDSFLDEDISPKKDLSESNRQFIDGDKNQNNLEGSKDEFNLKELEDEIMLSDQELDSFGSLKRQRKILQ